MSDWIGPNVYRVESYLDKTKHLSLHDGKREDGTPVNIFDPNKYNLWEFVYLGIGKSGKDEYHLINTHSGTYLTIKEPESKDNSVTGSVMPPRDARVRWHVIPTRSGNGTYWITSVADPKRKLTPQDKKKDTGTLVHAWSGSIDEKACWWYLRLADDATLQCPDLGKAKA